MKEFTIKNLKPEELVIVNKWPQFFIVPMDGSYTDQYIKLGHIKEEESCNLRYSMEFGIGWLGLADKLAERACTLVDLLVKSGIQPDARITSCIMKEKFGTLTNQGDHNLTGIYREIWRVLESHIEYLSSQTCEVCGDYGKLDKSSNWVKALCEKHSGQEKRYKMEPEQLHGTE